MRLDEIADGPVQQCSFALGRMNPATIGHELLVEAIKKEPGDSFLFLTDRPPAPDTDPLTPEEKLDWARKSFNGIAVGLSKTVLTAADRLYKMGYRQVTFLEGEDKLYKLLMLYNGKSEGKKGPLPHYYNFEKINYVKLQRDATKNDATGMSGTKIRQFVLDNDFNNFSNSVTDPAKPYAKEMFELLQRKLGVTPTDNDEA